MTEDQLKLEARLAAIEYVLTHLARTVFLSVGVTPETLATMRAQAKGVLQRETFPGVPPEFSDHMAAEIEEAVGDLLAEVERLVTGAWAKAAGRAV